MSVKVMGQVWDMEIPSNEKLVLLAYADHASHDGTGIWPAVALVARKTGYSEREIQRITRTLESKGLLIADGSGPHRTNRWRCPVKGDNLSPVTEERVTSASAEGDIGKLARVTPVSPESSLTVPQPSARAVLSEVDYVQAKAQVTAMIGQAHVPGYPNREKIPEPYLAYADAYNELTGQEPTKRVLQDWLMTFSEWQSERITITHLRQAHKRASGHFTVLRPGSLSNMAAAIKAEARLSPRGPTPSVRATKLMLEQRDRERELSVPMPDAIRKQLKAFTRSKSIEKDAT